MRELLLGLAVTILVGCSGESASSPPPETGGTAGKSGSGGTSGSAGGGGGAGGGAGSAGVGGGAGSGGTSGSGGMGGGGGDASAGAPGVCPSGASYPNPLPAGASASPVGGGYEFLEGPVWFAARGTLFFSNMRFSGSGADGVPPSTIYELTPPNTFTPFISSNMASNGLAIDQMGRLVACTHDTRSVSLIDFVSRMRSTLVDNYMGKKFSSPNDAIVRRDGTLYFTDPNWQLGNRTQEIQFKGVYRVAPGGAATLVSDALSSPNGIALSPDETKLYVTDDGTGRVHRFTVMSDGSTVPDAQPLATVSGADGMAVDCAGNLYVTSQQGIRVLNPNGGDVGTITVAQKPNNCTFGGSDRKTLYIAGRDTLFSVQLEVPGLP